MDIVEDFNEFRCEINISQMADIDSALQSFKQMEELFSDESIEYATLISGETANSSIETLDDLRGELDIELGSGLKTQNLSIKFSCQKEKANRLPIYSQSVFFEAIRTDFKSELNQWNEAIGKTLTIATRGGIRKASNYGLSENMTLHSLPDVIKNTKLLPQSFNSKSLINPDDDLAKYFKVLTAQFCLNALASSTSPKYKDENRLAYSFEGYARVTSTTQKDKDYIDQLENIVAVYNWVFIDNNYNTRLGILRNVVSLKSSDKILQLFNEDLLRILQSNYNIYLKDNIKQYIEVKNKTNEFMFSICKKADDNLEEYKATIQKVIQGIITYFFTVTMVKIFYKSEESIFTPEVASLTSILLAMSIIYLHFTAKDLERRKALLVRQLDTFKKQYATVIDKSELDSVFDPELIEKIDIDSSIFFKAGFWMLGLVGLIVFTILAAVTNII
jgi:hypothetical protein